MVGLRREGEDVGAGAAQDQGDLRQPVEVESAKVVQDGTGALQPDIPGMCIKLVLLQERTHVQGETVLSRGCNRGILCQAVQY